jgi:DNA-binding LacI/PurR family transcriptional regulator
LVKIRDVATHAGVSPATVSRTLNGDIKVSDEVRARVLASVRELGYRPNRMARNLRRQTSETIGVVVSDIENPHFTRSVRAIEDAAYKQGYRVILCNTDETPDKQRAYLEMLAAEQVVGVILAPADPSDPTISRLLDLNIPIVAFDRSVDDERADAVLADNVRAGRVATEHLLNYGRKHVGFIAGRPEILTGAHRLQGYEEAMRSRGLDPCIGLGNFRLEQAHAATLDMLTTHSELDGLVVANNLMAIGAVRALRERGVRVPDDVAFVGIDDPSWASLIAPAMTTLAQPTQEMATSAFELLIDRIENRRSQSRFMIFHFELHARESSGSRRVQAVSRDQSDGAHGPVRADGRKGTGT